VGDKGQDGRNRVEYVTQREGSSWENIEELWEQVIVKEVWLVF
jgi:hypothetical protein